MLTRPLLKFVISSYWLQLFMHKFRDGLALSLEIEAIFHVIIFIILFNLDKFSSCSNNKNLYQSEAIFLKYVLVALINSFEVFRQII